MTDTELTLEWEAEDKQPSAGESLFSKVKELLGLNKKDHDARFSDIGQAVEAIALSQKEQIELLSSIPLKELREEAAAYRQQIADMQAAHKKTADEFAEFKSAVEKMSDGKLKRPTATGGNNSVATDC